MLSLLLCIGTAILWARSDRFDQSLTWCRGSDQFTIRCVRGHLAAGWFAQAAPTPNEAVPIWRQAPLMPDEVETDLEWAISDEPSGTKSVSRWFGCHLTRETVTGDVQRWAEVPARSAAMFFSVLPVLWLAFTLRRQRIGKSRCAGCGTPIPSKTGATA